MVNEVRNDCIRAQANCGRRAQSRRKEIAQPPFTHGVSSRRKCTLTMATSSIERAHFCPAVNQEATAPG
jgi:hypothetical protein